MFFFNDKIKEKIREATPLLELVSEYTALKQVGENVWSGTCPHPDHEDSTPSFRVFKNPDGTYSWNCFGCKTETDNTLKDCFSFIQWINTYKGSKPFTFYNAVEFLAKRAKITLNNNEEEYNRFIKEEETLLNNNKRLMLLAKVNMNEPVRKYLYDRGLNDEDINLWKIGFYPFKENNEHIYRITFPLEDKNKNIIGFSNRLFFKEDMQKGLGKYKNSSNSIIFKKRKYLYGYDKLDFNLNEIRITEGPVDVILAHKYRLKNCVATLGTSFTEDHLEIIKKDKLIPVFIFDGDTAGLQATERAVKMCTDNNIQCKICILPSNIDLAELSIQEKENIEEWVKEHTTMFWHYKIKGLANKFDFELESLRLKYLEKLSEVSKWNLIDTDKILLNSYIKEKFGIIL